MYKFEDAITQMILVALENLTVWLRLRTKFMQRHSLLQGSC
jgi:hypothetical protein